MKDTAVFFETNPCDSTEDTINEHFALFFFSKTAFPRLLPRSRNPDRKHDENRPGPIPPIQCVVNKPPAFNLQIPLTWSYLVLYSGSIPNGEIE